MKRFPGCTLLLVALLVLSSPAVFGADRFTVASYNVENYLDLPAGNRQAKSPSSKAQVRKAILAIRPDVLALQEIGTTNALLELRASLQAEGLDYPHWEHVPGSDPYIHVAVLSRFPIVARRSHSRDGFLLHGRRFRMSRGIAEVDIQVNPRYRFTLFTAHLKSRRPVPEADQADLREQEALILREKFEARLKQNPNANIIVAGDLNDVKGARSTRIILGRKNATLGLLDTRPAERNGDDHGPVQNRYSARSITWTHYYGKEDSYSRIDYLLLSRSMIGEWLPQGTYVLAQANWGEASDHRPIVAAFIAQDR